MAGFAFYTFPLIVIYLIPIGLWLLYRLRLTAWRGYLIALAGVFHRRMAVVGALIQSGGVLLAETTGAGVAGTIGAPSYIETLIVRLLNYLVFGLSAWWGLRYPWSADFVLPLLRVRWRWLSMRARASMPLSAGARVLWGMILTLLVTFLITPFGGDPSGRYFVPLFFRWRFLLHCCWNEFASKIGHVAIALCCCLVTMLRHVAAATAATRDHDAVRSDHLDRSQPRSGVDRFSAGARRNTRLYQLLGADPIAFLSGERIISAATLPYHLDLAYTPRDDRYPPYTLTVRQSPSCVLHHGRIIRALTR